MNTDIELLKAQAKIELDKLESQADAKDVAGDSAYATAAYAEVPFG